MIKADDTYQSLLMRKLPPLNAMRAFEAAARNASFTRAASELCVSQGAVSRHVSLLEAWLGVKLFSRERHGVELTLPGAGYFRTIKDALDQIEAGTRQLRLSPDDGRLRLKLPPTFAIRWLVPAACTIPRIAPGHRRADHDVAPARGLRSRGRRCGDSLGTGATGWQRLRTFVRRRVAAGVLTRFDRAGAAAGSPARPREACTSVLAQSDA